MVGIVLYVIIKMKWYKYLTPSYWIRRYMIYKLNKEMSRMMTGTFKDEIETKTR